MTRRILRKVDTLSGHEIKRMDVTGVSEQVVRLIRKTWERDLGYCNAVFDEKIPEDNEIDGVD